MGGARGVVFLVAGVALLLACSALSLAPETPEPGTPGAIPGFTRLTPGDRAMYAGPSWSPDGTRIVYSRSDYIHPGALPYTSELFVMDLETGETLQLTHNGDEDRDPDWSPDGMRIVFVRVEISQPGSVETGKIWLMTVKPDGSDERVLFECPMKCHDPKWSPNGQEVAFGADWIWLIGADATRPRRLEFSDFAGAGYPAWSPDGLLLAFSGSKEPYTPGMQSFPPGYLGVLDLVTGQENVLAEADAYEADWSADGMRILFSDIETVFIVPATGGLPRRLIKEGLSADLFDPAWSPDAKRVVLVFGSDIRISDLYVLDLAVYHNGALLRETPNAVGPPEG